MSAKRKHRRAPRSQQLLAAVMGSVSVQEVMLKMGYRNKKSTQVMISKLRREMREHDGTELPYFEKADKAFRISELTRMFKAYEDASGEYPQLKPEKLPERTLDIPRRGPGRPRTSSDALRAPPERLRGRPKAETLTDAQKRVKELTERLEMSEKALAALVAQMPKKPPGKR